MSNSINKFWNLLKELPKEGFSVKNLIKLIVLGFCLIAIVVLTYKAFLIVIQCYKAYKNLNKKNVSDFKAKQFVINIKNEETENKNTDLYSKPSSSTFEENEKKSLISSNYENNEEIFNLISNASNKNIKIVKPSKLEDLNDDIKESSFTEQRLEEEIAQNNSKYL